jgi:hypothetical protein
MRLRYETLLPLYRWVWGIWREKRYEAFRRILAPKRIGHLLDVGGFDNDWYGRGETVAEVTILNLTAPLLGHAPPGSPTFHTMAGDGRSLTMRDGEFEVVYSNSVIEHVGDFEDQKAFAAEMRRVGRKLWVQTPAFSCPVEPHYLGLFVHWIPSRFRWPCIRWATFVGLTGAAGEEGLRAIMNTTRLLTHREYRSLFPDCEIMVERMFWIIPKSYIAYRK